MSKNLSAKEREIIERQKALASKLKPGAFGENGGPSKQPPPPSSASFARKPSLSAKPKTVVDLTGVGGSATKTTTKTTATSAASRPASLPKSGGAPTTVAATSVQKPTNATTTVQKRPTLKRKGPPSALPPPKRTSVTAADTTNFKVERKEKKAPAGSLAKLVQHVASENNALEGGGGSTVLPTIHADDFWKYLRDWDFCSQYAQTVGPNNNGNENNNNNGPQSSRKPLPNIFLNAKQYVALWAPLCMAEARAQIVQEASLNMTAPVAVKATTSSSQLTRPNNGRNNKAVTDLLADSFDEFQTATYVQVQSDQKGDGNKINFMTHDLCLLLTSDNRDLMKQLRSGRAAVPPGVDPEDLDKLWDSAGLIGHVETGRQGVNGLILKVSKRKWAKMRNTKLMYLIKLGSNITALREFTALCRIDTLPLQRFLLGQHLEKGAPKKLSRNQSTQQLLDQMGGKAALGEGFLNFAKEKFNNSQLTAIAASAHEYGDGGFTLIKGPPGTGKTTTLVAVLNSLHIRQYNKYYDEVRRIASDTKGGRQHALEMARKSKPRLLVCAPSNAAVDNIILKIMEDGFVDGQGNRYNPSIIRVGVGQSGAVKAVALETKVDTILGENLDIGRLESSINGFRVELQRITQDIGQVRRKIQAMKSACDWPLSKDWEIRIEEGQFDSPERVYFVNHKEKITTYEVPPPPEPDEQQFPVTSMPEYRSYVGRIVKLVESYFSVKTHLERCTIVQGGLQHGANRMDVRMNLESHVLNSVHIVMTTLGSAGNRTLEGTDKFEVVVVDEAAQSVEPATLSALQLGSRHCVLVGDPQQLPATIFNVSGRNTKYDRSLFQRLEEAGQPVYMLNEQYRMHPQISHFPRHIFYGGNLLDGPNVRDPNYGNPLLETVRRSVANFNPFTILNLDSKEEKVGTSLSNPTEARLAVFLFEQLKQFSRGIATKSRIAIITPYAQQSRLLKQTFADSIGPDFEKFVEVNTVDAFQGREANIVIFSAVRASGSKGIGFLSDVRRMNVALTRAKNFLFVIARVESIIQNPYWKDLVEHARETSAVVHVPAMRSRGNFDFGMVSNWQCESPGLNAPFKPLAAPAAQTNSVVPRDPRIPPPPPPPPPPKAPPGKFTDPRKSSNGDAPSDPRKSSTSSKPSHKKPNDPRQKQKPAADPRKQASASNVSIDQTARPSDPRRRK